MSNIPIQTTPPTPEQCSNRALVPLEGGRIRGTAFWWPQMNGYAAKAIVYQDAEESDSCFSVLVWHDGCFPLDGVCNNCASPREPVHLHLCSAAQWLTMATLFVNVAGVKSGNIEDEPTATETLLFIAECKDCTPKLPQPFTIREERDAWSSAHAAGTGHTVLERTEEKTVQRKDVLLYDIGPRDPQ